MCLWSRFPYPFGRPRCSACFPDGLAGHVNLRRIDRTAYQIFALASTKSKPRLPVVQSSHAWDLAFSQLPTHPDRPTWVFGMVFERHGSRHRLGRPGMRRGREGAMPLMRPAAPGAQVLSAASNAPKTHKNQKGEPTHHQKQVRLRATVQKVGSIYLLKPFLLP